MCLEQRRDSLSRFFKKIFLFKSSSVNPYGKKCENEDILRKTNKCKFIFSYGKMKPQSKQNSVSIVLLESQAFSSKIN